MNKNNMVVSLKSVINFPLNEIGHKGKNLSTVMSLNINVPSGFLLTSKAYYYFLEFNKIKNPLLETIDNLYFSKIDVPESIDIINNLFSKSSIPEKLKNEINLYTKKLECDLYAVRSSSTEEDSNDSAWAGAFFTELNVDIDNLEESIINCWLSLFNEKFLYKIKDGKNIDFSKIAMPVIIQSMVQSYISGVSFSIDPSDGDLDIVVIESIFGLGEALVSGITSPDTYKITKSSKMIIEKNLRHQEKALIYQDKKNKLLSTHLLQKRTKISDIEIYNIFEKTIFLENYFKCPQDIEWAIVNNNLYILQSRPITTLKNNKPQKNSALAVINEFKKASYRKIYASKGLPYIYEDMIINHYINWDTVIICINKGDIVFSNQKSLNLIKRNNLRTTINELNHARSNFEIIYQEILNTDIKEGILLIQKFCSLINEYSKFDGNIWSFDKKEVIPQNTKECIDYVFINKNILRKKIDNVFFIKNSILGKLIKSISNKYNIEENELYYYRISELINLLENKSVVINIKKRLLNSLLCKYKNNVYYLDDEEALFSYDSLKVNLFNKNQSFLKGIPTLKTNCIIKGKAMKYTRDYSIKDTMISINDNSKYILITETTDPSMDLLIKNSIAIITEVGGILSHASISSREYGIPCIVGVNGIMDFVKNDDLLALNTITGEIKILEES